MGSALGCLCRNVKCPILSHTSVKSHRFEIDAFEDIAELAYTEKVGQHDARSLYLVMTRCNNFKQSNIITSL